jgi:hypothetical protein
VDHIADRLIPIRDDTVVFADNFVASDDNAVIVEQSADVPSVLLDDSTSLINEPELAVEMQYADDSTSDDYGVHSDSVGDHAIPDSIAPTRIDVQSLTPTTDSVIREPPTTTHTNNTPTTVLPVEEPLRSGATNTRSSSRYASGGSRFNHKSERAFSTATRHVHWDPSIDQKHSKVSSRRSSRRHDKLQVYEHVFNISVKKALKTMKRQALDAIFKELMQLIDKDVIPPASLSLKRNKKAIRRW